MMIKVQGTSKESLNIYTNSLQESNATATKYLRFFNPVPKCKTVWSAFFGAEVTMILAL